MKKLLEILSNPEKRMPLATLQKCEDVLKKMNLPDIDAGPEGAGNMVSVQLGRKSVCITKLYCNILGIYQGYQDTYRNRTPSPQPQRRMIASQIRRQPD